MSVNIVRLSSGEVLIDLSGDSVKPEVLVEGETTHDAAGDFIRGTMPDRGTVNASIDGMTTTSYTIPAGKHSGTGKVSLTNDIGNALAEISGGSGLSVPAHIDRINDEVSDQTDLIAQIKAALNGKAGGGTQTPTLVVKSGTTTSRTIDTGLSDVEQFFMYKESQTGTGLIHLHYTKSATSRMYASAWSTQNYGTKTITNGTGGVTVSGGTVTISATQATQGALTSNVTYKWIAVGTE